MNKYDFITCADVTAARDRIAPYINRTPLVRAESFTPEIYLKLETLQRTGAFKIRGAMNRILQLDESEKKRGVVTVSTGNHGRAVAYAARMTGTKATICMSDMVPQNKRDAIGALGADIVIEGHSQDEAAIAADRMVKSGNMVMVPPFDDPDILAGQATIGLEIHDDVPQAQTILVPLSGGGLMGGIAFAMKSLNPAVRVIGVSTIQCPAMARSIEAGKPVDVVENDSLADSLGGGIGQDNRYSFPLIRDLVDDIILVSEDEIAAAMRYLFLREGLVTEGGAAVCVAAILADKIDLQEPVVCVLSGRNVDMRHFLDIVRSS